MTELISREGLQYLVGRLLQNAREIIAKEEKDDFTAGRHLAYYEMLDILQTELYVYDEDLHAFGLDIDIDREIMGFIPPKAQPEDGKLGAL